VDAQGEGVRRGLRQPHPRLEDGDRHQPEPVEEFDLASFNVGEYTVSRAAMDAAATISSVLYPEDSTPAGKMLRLKQQFFFTSASLQVPTRLLPPLPSSRTSRIMHRW
jgi:hypothetical protein